MPESQRRLILANGEKYVQDQRKKFNARPPEMPRSYEQARVHLKAEVSTALDKLSAIDPRKRFQADSYLCLRLHPDMIAKTYDPHTLFEYAGGLSNVGSRNYNIAGGRVAQTKRVQKLRSEAPDQPLIGRMVFVKGSLQGYHQLLRLLDAHEEELSVAFKNDIQRIEKFDLLSEEEQLLGFPADWTEGRVEVVLHPTNMDEDDLLKFLQAQFEAGGLESPRISLVQYPNGPSFGSVRLDRAGLRALAGVNPLRVVHPLAFGGLQELRVSEGFPTPTPSSSRTRSTIKVGVFDGGIDLGNPLLAGHCEQDDALSIKTAPTAKAVAHGTAVAGAILYGALNGVDSATEVPKPRVSVVSIRTLPTSDPLDFDLYESIEVIEAAVPARPDISVYNLSFGPRGPILDDTISRFTYALDHLAAVHKVTFCVAVGNDGAAGEGLDRIQSPSDLVNGFGIGAHTIRNGSPVRAPYSCKGPGRECAKIKPDLVAFGGCDQNPIHLLSSTPGKKALSYGTSFASPLVASRCGEAAHAFDRANPLLARALLVHTAKHPNGTPDSEMGHGILAQNLEDVLSCDAQRVTIVFQNSIHSKKLVRLPLMLPPGAVSGGKVRISWTIAALPTVDPRHPTDYTTCCIEDTFYAHSRIFKFMHKDPRTGKVMQKNLNLDLDAVEIGQLLHAGWKQSDLPVSESHNMYPTELERRALDYKWEPIVRRSASKLAKSLHEPFLVLHAIPRNGCTNQIEYAAVVTIEAPNHAGDLYDSVLRRFTALQPIRLRTETELRIQI